MLERRQSARARVIYGGVIAYNGRQSTGDYVIRNFSQDGAKVEFHNPALLPDIVELLIAKKNRAFSAKISWRQASEEDWLSARSNQIRRFRLIGRVDCGRANPSGANCRAGSLSFCPSTEWRSR